MSTTPLSEQSEEELRSTMIYYRMALKDAVAEGVDEEVKAIIMGWHDNAFRALVEASESFREYVLGGRFRHPLSKTEKNRAKYIEIAESVASES